MNETARRGYPLAALFVLVTACAAVIAGVAPVIQFIFKGEIGIEPVLWAIGLSLVTGTSIGISIGLLHYHWTLGAAIGTLAGITIGLVGGLLALAPTQRLPQITAALVVGSGLMVGVAIFLRQGKS